MPKDPMPTGRRDRPSARTPRAIRPPGDPDYRAVALRMLADFLTAGSKPPHGRPPRVPFPALPQAAPAGHPPASAMAAIGRFVEAARAGGLAAYRRRRG